MGTNSDQGSAISHEKFPGETFVNALEEYTKRIEASVTDIENVSEVTLSRMFALLIFIILLAAVLPLAVKVADEFQGSPLYLMFLQATMGVAFILLLGRTLFTVYTRLLRLRRYRRNLETLIWPYQKLLQKLSQIVDQGVLDEGTSTLIQLKIIEAEVAYSRARRVVDSASGSVVSALLFGMEVSYRYDPLEGRRISDKYGLSLEEAEQLLRRYGSDGEELRSDAERRGQFPKFPKS
jgi:hypothetical protein